MRNKVLFVTMTLNTEDPQGTGWPVAVYPTEAAALAAIEKCRQAHIEFDRLYAETINPLRPNQGAEWDWSMDQSEEYHFASKDGRFYRTVEWAEFRGLEFDFLKREDIQALLKQQTGEDYVQSARNELG